MQIKVLRKYKTEVIGFVFSLLIIVILGIFTNCFYPQELDTDEGMRLALSSCWLNGYSMYQEVWTDHPPLMVYIVAVFVHLFAGTTMFKLIPLFFMFMVLFYSYKTTVLRYKISVSLIAMSLFTTSFLFVKLSITLSLSICAIGFFVPSIYYLLKYRESNNKLHFVISALFLSASLLVKLICVYLAPLYLILFLWQRLSKPNLLKEVVVYMFLVLGVFLLVTIPVGMFQNLDKITQRWTESSKVAFSSFDNWGYIKNLFWETRSFWIVIVLGLGFGFANKRKLWNIEIVVALSWVLLTLVVFCFQKPLWYHYALLFTVPCYWIVTDSIQQIILFLEKYLKNKVHIVSTIAVLTLCFVGYKKATDMGETITSDYHNSDLRKMFSAHVPSDILMFTDRPYYGVMNGNQIIPELAVFTKTRFMSGHMTYPYFISLLDKYQPEYIVLGRYKLEDYELPFRNYLLKNYSHTHSEGKVMSFSKK